jgi:hypothetical protein
MKMLLLSHGFGKKLFFFSLEIFVFDRQDLAEIAESVLQWFVSQSRWNGSDLP